jgi:hypothetical protein
VPDVPPEQSTAARPRVAAFLVALVLVGAAAWTAGRVSSPPLPLPELPKPAVLGGPGAGAADGAPVAVLPHGGGGHSG